MLAWQGRERRVKGGGEHAIGAGCTVVPALHRCSPVCHKGTRRRKNGTLAQTQFDRPARRRRPAGGEGGRAGMLT